MYPAIAVANYFLDLASRDGEALTPLKLQKLVYIAHGWHLGLFDEALISETVEAWRWGPVVPDLYHQFKVYGRSPITAKGRTSREVGDPDTSSLISQVWELYRQYTGIQLANHTHEEGSPWHEVVSPYGGAPLPHHLEIPNPIIKAYYRAWAERED